IPNSEANASDTVFRVLLFKIFNRVRTWRLLEGAFGELHARDFDSAAYAEVLLRATGQGERIYSAAYIMPMPRIGNLRWKHEAHLALLQALMRRQMAERIAAAQSLRQGYELLFAVPSLGPFLAYQYTIDLNYSPLLAHSEMEFVVAGPGAKSGIAKCFADDAGLGDEDLIRYVCDRAEDEFDCLEVDFQDLWGRPLQL